MPDAAWWLQRQLFIGVSLVCTLPVIWLFARYGPRRAPVGPRVAPA